MKSTLHSVDDMEYESTVTQESKTAEGVRFTIRRMSFGRRLELTTRIREMGARIQFLESGGDLQDKVESALMTNEIERLYLQWGLKEIRGLRIDSVEATVDSLISDGPEELFREIVAAIKSECGLSEAERKN